MAATDINSMVGEFMEEYEQWEDNPAGFDWERLETLARAGAQAYNQGAGPSFQILVFEGYPYAEFHERLLGYLLDAGFDPFKTVQMAGASSYVAVFGHEGLAEAALSNPVAARMHQRLQGLARARLASADPAERQHIIQLCSESIPAEVLAEFAEAVAP